MNFVEKKRLLFFGLPFTFTTYSINDEVITVNSGFLRRVENDCYMYKITDVRLEVSLLQRIFGLGTVHCFGSDVTDPDLRLVNIKNAKDIKNFILTEAEDSRLRHRVLNTQKIDVKPGVGEGDTCH